jgi:phenylpropionate dioxygenase-like ring-hydroxylating dioxygenase large terminal subunit
MFLRNEWYVAALSAEISSRPIQRLILGEALALFRTESGRAVALADRCPHRGAPLSSGEVHGETLACGYHGFTFDTDGACVHVPGMERVPALACVKSYAVIERWGWVFVWMGDATHADSALLPDFKWMGEPGWVGRSEYLKVKSGYTLVRDNLLDLTHARFVHKKTLATSAVTDHPVHTHTEGRRLRITREMPDIEPSPFFKRMGGFDGRVDHRQCIDFFPPCYVLINTRVSSVAGSLEDRAAEFYVLNALTPETTCSTHYFWGLVRNFAIDDDSVTETQQKLNRETFYEDLAILEQQQMMLDTAPADWRPVPVPNDGGCIQAERLMNRLLAAQQAGSQSSVA